MILRKKTFNLDEQQAMREAAGLLTQLLRLLYQHTTVGVCGQDLVRYAWQFLKEHHCQANFFQYHGFPAPICVSVNENLIHGIPDEYLFQAGDLVSVDAGLLWKQKYHTDAAFTKIITGVDDPTKQNLVISCAQALQLAISQVRPYMHTGDLGSVIGTYLQQTGYFCPPQYTGHGIGRRLHDEPIIPNEGQRGAGPLLLPGMVICIEPMAMTKTVQVRVLSDGWTVQNAKQGLATHFEAMVLITPTGYEQLTPILLPGYEQLKKS